MTFYEYGLLRGARQMMTADEVAIAVELARKGDAGDTAAAVALWDMAVAIVNDPERSGDRAEVPPVRRLVNHTPIPKDELRGRFRRRMGAR
jgi:hypothetical protein